MIKDQTPELTSDLFLPLWKVYSLSGATGRGKDSKVYLQTIARVWLEFYGKDGQGKHYRTGLTWSETVERSNNMRKQRIDRLMGVHEEE